MSSADVTHAHPEAVLGAAAVAVAAAEAGWARLTRQRLEPAGLVDLVLAYLIDGRVMTGIVSVAEAAYERTWQPLAGAGL